MKNPLVAPVVALASGIAISRWAGLGTQESLVALFLLAVLTAAALRWSPRVVLVCALVTAAFCGAALETLHRPGPPPEIDAGARETVILDGCVVAPPAFYEGRDQFVAGTCAASASPRQPHNPRRRDAARSALRTARRVRSARAPHPQFPESRRSSITKAYSARSDIYWTAAAAGAESVKVEAGPLRIALLRRYIRAAHRARCGASSGSIRAIPTPPA